MVWTIIAIFADGIEEIEGIEKIEKIEKIEEIDGWIEDRCYWGCGLVLLRRYS